jgi:hypothetical protein
MAKATKTEAEIKERDREYHRQKYEENLEDNRAKARERYYKKKANNPNFNSKPRGRPRNAPVAPVAPVASVESEPVMKNILCEF